MVVIRLKCPNGVTKEFRYLEEVAEYLENFYQREVFVSDIERQVEEPFKGCYIVVFGDKYFYRQKEF